jgi:hypothetical protein
MQLAQTEFQTKVTEKMLEYLLEQKGSLVML